MLHHLSDGEGFSSEKAVKTWNMQPIRGTTDVSWTQKTKQSLWIPHDPSVQARGWPLTFSRPSGDIRKSRRDSIWHAAALRSSC